MLYAFKLNTLHNKEISWPHPQYNIEDVAHTLSWTFRFRGHTVRPYSVAEHCVRATQLADSIELKMAVLLHDSSEFIVGDMPSPIKRIDLLQGYRTFEKLIQDEVYEQLSFPISETLKSKVKEIDLKMLKAEAYYLTNADVKFKPELSEFDFSEMHTDHYKKAFIDLFYSLKKQLNNEVLHV